MQETFQAVGSLYGGKAAKAQAQSEALLAERQARDVDLQAMQASEARRAELRQNMSTIEARRAAAGVGLDSPSALAISRALRKQTSRAESIDRVGFGNQRTALLTTAAMKRAYGKTAAVLGYVNAAGHLAGAAEKAASAKGGGGGKS